MGALRGIEEFINIPMYELDDEDIVHELLAIRLDDTMLPMHVAQVRTMLIAELAPPIVDGLVQTLISASAIGHRLRMFGLECGEELRSIAGAVGYFQSRRRQMVALMYCIPADWTENKSVTFSFIPFAVRLQNCTKLNGYDKCHTLGDKDLMLRPERYARRRRSHDRPESGIQPEPVL